MPKKGEGKPVQPDEKEYDALMEHGDTATSTPDDTAEIVEVTYGDGE